MDAARDHVARDCAADIAGLLASGATWDGRPLEAGHVAVLVSATASTAMLVQEALADRGVPAVVAGGGHVFLTPGRRRLAGPARRRSSSRTGARGCGPPR